MSMLEIEALQKLEEIMECRKEMERRRRIEQGKELPDQSSKSELKRPLKAVKKRGNE